MDLLIHLLGMILACGNSHTHFGDSVVAMVLPGVLVVDSGIVMKRLAVSLVDAKHSVWKCFYVFIPIKGVVSEVKFSLGQSFHVVE